MAMPAKGRDDTMPKEIKLAIAFIAYLFAAMAIETILFS
jgi:hypothetical protein